MPYVSINLIIILLSSIANINSVAYNVQKDGGNSIKTALIVEKKSHSLSQQKEKISVLTKSQKNLQKMTKILFQDVYSVGQILMKMRRRKPVILAVPVSFTRDV